MIGHHTKSFNKVRAWLRVHDPMGLFPACPDDEYDNEAKVIAGYLDYGGLHLGDFCFFYWQSQFIPYPKDTFERVRKDWNAWAKELKP